MTAAARAELRAAIVHSAEAATACRESAVALVDVRVRATAAYENALAEIRAIRGSSPTPAPEAVPSTCCAGDRAGYLRHRWHNEQPCAASRQANTDYSRNYCATTPGERERRRRREQARRRGQATTAVQ